MKLLWISNAPWAPSGYGSQTRQVGARIAAAGYPIEFVANDGTRGDQMWNGLYVRGSSGTDRYSRDSLRDDIERSGADAVISLYDAWVYTQGMRDPFEDIPNVAAWLPIDHYPVPGVLHQWLSNDHLQIAMSKFGRDSLTALSNSWRAMGDRGFEVRYAPHAIDDVYRRVETQFREAIDVPDDAFLVGIVAANTDTLTYDRKGFGDMITSMAALMHARSDVYLYIHAIQKGFNAMDLPLLLQQKQIPMDRIAWADQYALKKHSLTDAHMAQIYSSFDLLLATSRGEGFGVPVIEAAAAGVPVVASNWTAQAELVRGEPWTPDDMRSQEHPHGWLVYCDPDYDPRQVADFGKPSIGGIISALERAYSEWQAGRWDERRAAAIAFSEQYRADAVFETYWKPILAEMAERAERRPTGLNRQQRRALAKASR